MKMTTNPNERYGRTNSVGNDDRRRALQKLFEDAKAGSRLDRLIARTFKRREKDVKAHVNPRLVKFWVDFFCSNIQPRDEDQLAEIQQDDLGNKFLEFTQRFIPSSDGSNRPAAKRREDRAPELSRMLAEFTRVWAEHPPHDTSKVDVPLRELEDWITSVIDSKDVPGDVGAPIPLADVLSRRGLGYKDIELISRSLGGTFVGSNTVRAIATGKQIGTLETWLRVLAALNTIVPTGSKPYTLQQLVGHRFDVYCTIWYGRHKRSKASVADRIHDYVE